MAVAGETPLSGRRDQQLECNCGSARNCLVHDVSGGSGPQRHQRGCQVSTIGAASTVSACLHSLIGIAMTTIHYGQAQSLRAQARTQNVTLA